jgi:hypothetical protein
MRAALVLIFGLCLLNAGTETKAKPTDYPASAEVSPGFTVSADFGGHTVFAGGTTYLVEDFVCIEVALFPVKDAVIKATDFSLRLNKHKAILAQTPGMVAASMKYPDWTQKPRMEGQAGPIAIGGQHPQGRFPGDEPDRRTKYPAPAGTDPTSVSGAERAAPANPAELVVKVALEEGPAHAAKSGYLYFPYRGKLSKLNSIELVYGETVVKLR